MPSSPLTGRRQEVYALQEACELQQVLAEASRISP